MITTALTDMFRLQYPIVLAPMGSVSGGHLAATVSNAGGLGLVGGGYGDATWLRKELSRAKEETRRPWGVGLITWSINQSVLKLALSYQPDAFMLSFGDPRPYARMIKSAGCKLPLSSTSTASTSGSKAASSASSRIRPSRCLMSTG